MPKLCPKVILEGTRLTHKTDIAFALNEHPRVVGPRKYRQANAWTSRTMTCPGWWSASPSGTGKGEGCDTSQPSALCEITETG
ncbi:MAG TPA: hypothetical protein VMC62_03230 [Longilinea sp.]|nr:hypothetical protein [Longilinea sp.]